MSLEFTCSNCRIALRVSPDQLGRQVRCPVCGVVTVFGEPRPEAEPSEPQPSFPVEEPPKHQTQRQQPPKARGEQSSRGGWSPVPPLEPASKPQVTRAETRARAQEYVATYSSTNLALAPDRAWWVGLICGLISILGGNLVCFCCLLGPFGSTIFALVGLAATAFSQSGPKAVNIVLGILGLAISLITMLLMAFANMG